MQTRRLTSVGEQAVSAPGPTNGEITEGPEEVRLRIFNSDAPIGPVQPANLKSGCTIPWLLIAKPGALTAPLVGIDSLRRVYLNYRQTTWEELRRDLEGALRGLPAQVVYLDGDNDILFMDAAQALDTIQGLGARAIL